MLRMTLITAALALVVAATATAQGSQPNDAQIAHIAYTAGVIDIEAGKLALSKSHSRVVREFAREMVRDHGAVNDQALALVKRLGVMPQDNPTSAALRSAADARLRDLRRLKGRAFDRAYVANEVAFHRTVNQALASTLIPAAQNGELKSLLQTGLKLFTEHQHHAEMLKGELK